MATRAGNMVQFAHIFPDEAIVVTLSRRLGWSHVHALLPIKDALARDFYSSCRTAWTVVEGRQGSTIPAALRDLAA